MNQFSTLERLKLSQRIQNLHHKIDRGHYTNEDLAKLEYYEYLYKGSNRATTLDTKDPSALYAASHGNYSANYGPLFERVSFNNIDSQLRPYINRRLPELNKFNNTLKKNQSFLERFKSRPIKEDDLVKQQILKSAQKSFNIAPSGDPGAGLYAKKPQVFLDIETDDTNRPIAITAVKTRFNNATNKFETIDFLQRYYKTPDSRLKTTGLIHKYTSDTLLQLRQQQGSKYSSTYGISERGILRRWIGNATVSGHNIMDFDLPVLFPRNQIRSMDVIDTVDIARSIYGTTRGPNDLDTLLKKLTGKNMSAWGLSHHDQNADVKASMLITQALVRSNTSYAHDIKVVLNTAGLSIAPFEGGQGFGTSIIRGDPTKVGPGYDRTNYLTLEERMTLEEAERKINGKYYDDNGNEVPADNPGVSLEDTLSDLVGDAAEKLRTQAEFSGPKGPYSNEKQVADEYLNSAAHLEISQALNNIGESLLNSQTAKRERILKTLGKFPDEYSLWDENGKLIKNTTLAQKDIQKLAKAFNLGDNEFKAFWEGSRAIYARNEFNKGFTNLKSLIRHGLGSRSVTQSMRNMLGASGYWTDQASAEIEAEEALYNDRIAYKKEINEAGRDEYFQNYIDSVNFSQQAIKEGFAKIALRDERLKKNVSIDSKGMEEGIASARKKYKEKKEQAERERLAWKKGTETVQQYELERDASKHYSLYKDYRKGKVSAEDYASMVNTGAIHSDDAISNLYKKINEGAESTKRWTNAIDAFKQSVGGIYDFRKWIDAGHEQSKGVLGALKGLVPSEVLGAGARFNEAYFGAQYANYYGKRKIIEPAAKIGNAAIAAGFALAPVTGGTSLIVSGIGAGVSGISQAIGTYGENKIKEKGQMLQSSINLLGGTMDTIFLPFRLLGKVLRTVIKSFLALSGLIGGITVKGLRNMIDMGNPLTTYTGMNYNGYSSSVAGDYGALLRRGSLESLRNTFTTDARGLYTTGKLNTNKVVAASMLGVFGDLYNPTAGADPVAAIANKAYERMQGASADEKSRIMYLLGEIGGSELQGLVQSMNTLGMTYEDITDPRKRGVTWTERNENLRKQFQLDQYEFQSIGENIKWNGMRIADKLWNKIGKPVYNGLNDIVEMIANNNWDGVLTKLKDFWGQIKSWWDNSEDASKIKDILNKPIQGFIDGVINGFQSIGTEVLKVMKNMAHSLWDIIYPFMSKLADIDILATISPFNHDGVQFKSKTPTEAEINDEVEKMIKKQTGFLKEPIVESDPIYKKIYQSSAGTVDTRNMSRDELKKLAAARLIAKKGNNVGAMITALQKTGLFSEEELKKYYSYDPTYDEVHRNIDNTFSLNKDVLNSTAEFIHNGVNSFIFTFTDGSKDFGKIVVDSLGRVVEATGLGIDQKIGNIMVKAEKGE